MTSVVTNTSQRAAPSPDWDDASLVRYLTALIQKPPVRVDDRTSPIAIDRIWKPAARRSSTLTFLDRHAVFEVEDRTTPVRARARLSRSSKHGWRGVFQSRKMARAMFHHTGLELDLLRYCEVDPGVSQFVEHPARIYLSYPAPSPCISFVPSAYVERAGEQWFVICRWEASAIRSENEVRWARIGTALAAAGFGFEVVTERHFGCPTISRNVDTLLRGRWSDRPPSEAAAQAIGTNSDVEEIESATGLSTEQLWQLVLDRKLAVDLAQSIGPKSLLANTPIQRHEPLWRHR